MASDQPNAADAVADRKNPAVAYLLAGQTLMTTVTRLARNAGRIVSTGHRFHRCRRQGFRRVGAQLTRIVRHWLSRIDLRVVVWIGSRLHHDSIGTP